MSITVCLQAVELLPKNFLNTHYGTTHNQKFIKQPSSDTKPSDQNYFESQSSNKINKVVQKKKEKYIQVMVPIVTIVYKKLQAQYESVKRDIESGKNQNYITTLKKQYKAKTDQLLLQALKPHPISIVLAQGAVESAWLDSRFAKSANNVFGVWSFDTKEPRIEASDQRGKKNVYLKQYKTLKAAVEDYYLRIAKSWAYKKFRYLRTQTNNPFILLPHLQKYSEKREKYTKLLENMIRANNFDRYDINETTRKRS
ncbi:MAG: glucosaminidase domain-containing protein [Campylobacterales bacterium]|nr:glucosaminidase domain-containing protein [Campylobacterales bacterium]